MDKRSNYFKRLSGIFLDGVIWDNPTFVQLLGMCPTLAVSTSFFNGLGMGLSATFVLTMSNFFISLLRKFIPQKVRIASYVVVISSFVIIIELVLKAYFPDLSTSLGVFIPLIVVNCIILARAEVFASKNAPLPSVIDGISNGLGFTLALLIISIIREVIGNGTIAGFSVFGQSYSPALIIIMPAGGFLVLGFVIAGVQFIMMKANSRGNAGK